MQFSWCCDPVSYGRSALSMDTLPREPRIPTSLIVLIPNKTLLMFPARNCFRLKLSLPVRLAIMIQVLTLPALAQVDKSTIDFEKQVAPIFSEHCLRCHSNESPGGDVSVSTADSLFDGGYVIAGAPDSSSLMELVESHDESPPEMPKEGRALSRDQVELLKAWIRQGAHWPIEVVLQQKSKADASWWAYQPLQLTEPQLSQTVVNPSQVIDSFVLEKLAERGLAMNPQADRRTLIRRLSFDLHGIPPTPEQVDTFLSDTDTNAYEKLVDHFLASPRYGERYAQHWLDIAHYADTHGFERDQRRNNAWRYRDYVIAALNSDKPYDRFLQEQIAGDVLWPDVHDAVIATGFLAAGPWDFVGHVETRSPELRRAARALDLDDMLTQVMAASMAMTVNCARCHDHKLDPISQREYYELKSVFAGVGREERFINESDVRAIEQRRAELRLERNRLLQERGELLGEGISLAQIVGGGDWPGTGIAGRGIDVRTGKPSQDRLGGLENVIPNRFIPSEEPLIDGVFVPTADRDESHLVISSTGLRISELPKTSLSAWDLIRNGPVNSQYSNELGGIDFTSDRHDLLGFHANSGITFDLQEIRQRLVANEAQDKSVGEPRDSSLQTSSPENETLTNPLRLTGFIGYFGAEGEFLADVWIYVDGKLITSFKKLRRSDGLQPIDLILQQSSRFLTLISTDGGNGYSHDQVGFGDPRIRLFRSQTLSPEEIKRVDAISARLAALENDLETLVPPRKFYGVTGEKSVPEVRVLSRGNPETPVGEPLHPRAPRVLAMLAPDLGSLDSNQAHRREALARWITTPENPLVKRVIVNRLWQWHFGRGIVDTPSDFGYGGSLPTHPELLDWLASYLVQCNWSLKRVHRAILLSSTYRQSSEYNEQASRIDGDNRWLWRQNPQRLDAEVLRDSVLSVSGKMNLDMGGPGFEDFEYEEAYAPIYRYVCADRPELWRRSIYRFVVRTTPNRFLTTLDCPDSANLTPKRLSTTTPLQSLALFNNEFMLRQSEYFAERATREANGNSDQAIVRSFELAFNRRPSKAEVELVKPIVEEHGLFTLCRSLLNSNEFLYVD